MSRTDVHRPYQVQLQDPHNRHRLYQFQAFATREPVLVTIYNTCGCRMCTGHHWRKLENRQERYRSRRELREALKSKGES